MRPTVYCTWLIFIQVNLHCCLNDLEAADYGEFVSILVVLAMFNRLRTINTSKNSGMSE